MSPNPQTDRDRYERILQSSATMEAQLGRLLSDVRQITVGAQEDRETADKRHQENSARIDDLEDTLKFARRICATLAALLTLIGLLWSPVHEMITMFRGPPGH